MLTLMTLPASFAAQRRSVPERRMLCAINHLRPDQLEHFVGGASLALPSLLTEQSLEQLGPVAVIYHHPVNEESSGPVEVCVPYQGKLNLPDGLMTRLEIAHQQAYIVLTKQQFTDSALFHAARQELEAYVRANGEPLGPLRQIDYAVWNTRGSQEVVGELAIAFKWFNRLSPNSRGRLFPQVHF